jgi:uncharacterized membrane protein
MKQQTIVKVVALIAVIVLVLQFDLLGVLFALVFLGMIPGTDLSIPPWVMMIGYPLAIVAAIFWLVHQPLYIGSREKQEKTARAVARKRVAKKASKAAAKRRTARA